MPLTRESLEKKLFENIAEVPMKDGDTVFVRVMSASQAIELQKKLLEVVGKNKDAPDSDEDLKPDHLNNIGDQLAMFRKTIAESVLEDAGGEPMFTSANDSLFAMMDLDTTKELFSAVMEANGMKQMFSTGDAEDDSKN